MIVPKMKYFLVFLFSISAVYSEVSDELQKGNIKFSASLYQKVLKENPGNIILSPLSLQIILALTNLGAKGNTAAELQEVLQLPDTPEKVKQSFKALTSELKGNEDYSLNAANKIYLKKNYVINPVFLNLSKEIFDAGLETVDFAAKAEAANIINKWVESKTKDKIKNLIDPETLNENTRMVLVNALHFEGLWDSPFEEYRTFKRTFYKSANDQIPVDTMHQTSNLKYTYNRELDAKMVQLVYKGNKMTFTIVLPNQIEGLGAIESKLEEVLRPQEYNYEYVSLSMPKFKMESSFELIPTLRELGIKDAFDPLKSDFSGLLVGDEHLMITDVIQKAFINVTESGTEAAAATAVIVGNVADSFHFKPIPLEVRVDRPFFYVIRLGDLPLFVGRVKMPTV